MNNYHKTPMPHLEVFDDGILPIVSKKIFDYVRKSTDINSLLTVIRDRNHFIPLDWEQLILQDWKEKGFVFGGKNVDGDTMFLSLIDIVNMEHSAIAEETFLFLNEDNQDTLMHFGFEEFQHMSILEFCTLLSLTMIDLTDVLLYRDYTNYKDGYVKHFISTDYSEDKNHLFVINLSKTIGSYLLNEKNEISVRNDEEFSMKVIEWIGEIRKDLFLTPVFLKQNNTNYVELMKELVYNSVLLSERNKENKLKYYEYQMKSLKTHNKFEAAAQVREKIKNFNN